MLKKKNKRHVTISLVLLTLVSVAPCDKPTTPAHGERWDRDFKHGRSVRFYCSNGYQRIGASSITCNDGTWDNKIPVCKGKKEF